MLEITADDVARLDDKQLRELVGLLCESELRRQGLSPAAVTYGGDQNAADGGIDVHVGLPAGAEVGGFIPRPTTGFQVKKQEMPPGAITDEMAPEGTLRPSIAAPCSEHSRRRASTPYSGATKSGRVRASNYYAGRANIRRTRWGR
jgi:hypothetical protein